MRLSRRPLPEADASVDRISEEDRAWLIRCWSGRADAERAAGNAFRFLARELRSIGVEPQVQALVDRAIADEEYHSRICHRMASIFSDGRPPESQLLPLKIPLHAGAPEELRPALHVVGQCCLNETTATVFYETCLSGARSRPARTALRALLSDEIDHARIGWAYLTSPRLADEVRTGIAARLPTLVNNNLRAWSRRLPMPQRPPLVENGAPAYQTGMEAVESALRDLIVPGFSRLGFDTSGVVLRTDRE